MIFLFDYGRNNLVERLQFFTYIECLYRILFRFLQSIVKSCVADGIKPVLRSPVMADISQSHMEGDEKPAAREGWPLLKQRRKVWHN